jgi:hypothetical protein
VTQQSTATVETLTAEVRVLMVGNRQITASVAKQLDQVRIMEIEVFGRISIAFRNDFADGWVIGRRRSGSDLVIAAYQHRRSGNPEVDALHVAARRAPLIVLAGLR